ncbi:MAG: membrane protein insertase YidC [Gemmatimonadota bacterium]|nr:MAG: membrane protein insertase YidC [Gemmatimonadota bacterium]
MGTEKRLVLAVVLMMAVVFAVNLLFPPAPPPEPGGPADTTAVSGEQTLSAPQERQSPPPERPAAEPAPQLPIIAQPREDLAEDTIWVETPLFRLGFGQRGARLVSAEMREFESLAPATKGAPVQLVPSPADNFFTHRWLVGDDTLDLGDQLFQARVEGLTLSDGGSPQTLTFSYQHPEVPMRLELDYTFRPDKYLIDFVGRLRGVPATGWWTMGLGSGLLSNEWDPEEDYKNNLAFAGKGPEGVESQKIASLEPGDRMTLNGPFDWVAVRTKYFVTAMVLPPEAGPDRRFGGLLISSLQEPFRAEGVASFPVGRDGEFAYTIYLGPQDFGRLSAAGRDLNQVTPYGYRWLQPVLRPLAGAITSLLVWMHRFLGLGYGWILILFGVGIRVVLFPLYQKSMRSQMATMRVQPLMKEIQNKYKNDPQKLQQEMMKLYREHGVNPLGGCLPMLLPFPILIALFFVFRDTIEFRGVPFLWLPDLSRADPLYIIPVLMGASVFLLQWISQRTMPQSNPQMKMMMWFMPIMLTVLFLNFASGLNLYYATKNLASQPQQLYLAKERRAAAGQPAPTSSAKAKT